MKIKEESTLKEKISVMLATWFYTGFIPPIILKGMAGTYGSFFSLPLCLVIFHFGGENSPLLYGVAICVIFLIGLMTVSTAEKAIGSRTDWRGKTKTHDQNQIVIDETLGMLITCYPLSLMHVNNLWLAFSLAFVLFRFFDIVKLPPAGMFDRMENSFGVMMDDAVAGIQAAIILTITIQKGLL